VGHKTRGYRPKEDDFTDGIQVFQYSTTQGETVTMVLVSKVLLAPFLSRIKHARASLTVISSSSQLRYGKLKDFGYFH
jgi:hypothetical protein